MLTMSHATSMSIILLSLFIMFSCRMRSLTLRIPNALRMLILLLQCGCYKWELMEE